MNPEYTKYANLVATIATIGLYSVLYKENKFYRFFEHIFLGLASGWAIVALVKDVLYPSWWQKMVYQPAKPGSTEVIGNWPYALLLPIALMGYLVFSKKHNWMARIPLGIILGLFSGQQIAVFWKTVGPQVLASMRPIWPTTWESFIVPAKVNADGSPLPAERLAEISSNVYPSQAIGNFLAVFTIISIFSYFLFSFNVKNKGVKFVNSSGRLLLMIGFGAIFGSTVMMRFTLLIDRMYFIWIETISSFFSR